MALALINRLIGLTTTRSWRFLTRAQQEKMLTRVLKEEIMPDAPRKQPQPPQALLIDLHDLIMDGFYEDKPSDMQRQALKDLLGQYVAEYKPCL